MSYELTTSTRVCVNELRAVLQVEGVRARSELILRGLQPGKKYEVRVRVKLDGISYNGYWSAWSDPVFMETLPAGGCSSTDPMQVLKSCLSAPVFNGCAVPPPELNPLIVSLTVIISFILMVLSLTALMTHRRSVG